MLEDHPVQNLHYDSNLRIAQAPRVEPTSGSIMCTKVYSVRNS